MSSEGASEQLWAEVNQNDVNKPEKMWEAKTAAGILVLQYINQSPANCRSLGQNKGSFSTKLAARAPLTNEFDLPKV